MDLRLNSERLIIAPQSFRFLTPERSPEAEHALITPTRAEVTAAIHTIQAAVTDNMDAALPSDLPPELAHFPLHLRAWMAHELRNIRRRRR